MFKKIYLFCLIYMNVLPLCMYVCYMHGAWVGHPLELVVVSQHVGTGNQTWVLCDCNKCSLPTEPPLQPYKWYFLRRTSSWAVVLVPLIPTLREADAPGALWGQGQPNLQTEFQDNQRYTEKFCLEKLKKRVGGRKTSKANRLDSTSFLVCRNAGVFLFCFVFYLWVRQLCWIHVIKKWGWLPPSLPFSLPRSFPPSLCRNLEFFLYHNYIICGLVFLLYWLRFWV